MWEVITANNGLITAAAVSISAVTGLYLALLTYRNSKVRLCVRITPKMTVSVYYKTYADYETTGPYVSVEVTNIGEKRTTIKELCLRHYPDLTSLIKRKRKYIQISKSNAYYETGGLPYKIDGGGLWRAHIPHTPEIVAMGQKGWLYVNVYRSGVKKPISKRLKMDKKLETKDETPPTKEQASS